MKKFHSYKYSRDSEISSSSSSSSVELKWRDYIDADGNVFYFDSLPERQPTPPPDEAPDEDKYGQTGLIRRLIRRRNSIRQHRHTGKHENNQDEGNKPNSDERKTDSNIIYVNIVKYKDVSLNLGRRGTLTEQNLGLRTVHDKDKVLITGVIEDSPFIYKPKINIGDVLISVNNFPVSPRNADSVISECKKLNEIIVAVERHKGEKDKNKKHPNLVFKKDAPFPCNNTAVLFAKFKSLSEEMSSDEGIVYLYPKTSNLIVPIKGVFFTLYHLLSLITGSPPTSTCIKLNNEDIHVVYSCEKDKLFLLALPNSRYSLDESFKVAQQIIQYHKYLSQSLSRWFESDIVFIDNYYFGFFESIQETIASGSKRREFEEILMATPFLPVPRDIYIQIDDALNELESNDIFIENSQRVFSIVGSAYLCKGKIICSHMSNEELVEVTTTFRHSGLLKMSETGVKELIYWREVFPSKYMRGLLSYSSSLYSVPVGRWFLLVVAQGNNFLAVLLESGGPTESYVLKGPDQNYVEEAQATLEHIISLGIPQIISKWTGKLCDEEVKSFEHRSVSASTSHQNLSVSEFSSKASDYYEPDVEGRMGENIPVLGRRAERELANEVNMRLRISSSDISDDSDFLKEGKHFDHSSETSDSRNTYQNEIERPLGRSQFVLHYVDFNMTEGIFISSPGVSPNVKKLENVMNNFRKYAHKIKKMFMNTISFKLKSKELHRFVWNKSLVAIKEFGILFNAAENKEKPLSYWVTGRLFSTPILREFYVCYHDACPQNLVELAFSLALSYP
ncbi:protein inturned isoform X2 [Cimex lectularius]|uniref:Protein inturned n=1 Tax=Cimex lectularius TaxID=79782 RepID=A0A8I6TC80_CIMLE|nr:protein inturned isoform X2 [Cimex lectularius]